MIVLCALFILMWSVTPTDTLIKHLKREMTRMAFRKRYRSDSFQRFKVQCTDGRSVGRTIVPDDGLN